MVEGLTGFSELITINTTAVSSTLALLKGTVEPDDSVKATSSQHLRRQILRSRLNKQEGFLHFNIALDSLLLLAWLVATKRLFKELGLGIAGREVDKNPAERISLL